MNIKKLCEYTAKPTLFEKGTSVMWTDPYISSQLLKCHIDPTNDMASRTDKKIELLVNWILSKKTMKHMQVLDLGCGPGLYAEKLAKKGHRVTGVDFSKGSIEYAEHITKQNDSNIKFICDDYLNINYEDKFDLVILIYLDFCVLKPNEREIVLGNVYKALKKGGVFIFDVVNNKNINDKILKPSWEICQKGFWKDEPYIAFNMGYHYPENKVFVNQHIVIDQNENIETYLFWTSYYTYEDLAPMLKKVGFSQIRHFENVLPEEDVWNGDNVSFYRVVKD
jgi:SAM-dependent methyltransferase